MYTSTGKQDWQGVMHPTVLRLCQLLLLAAAWKHSLPVVSDVQTGQQDSMLQNASF